MRTLNWIPLTVALLLCAAGCREENPWSAQELGTDARFQDVFFLDDNRGWIVGGGYPIEGGIIGSTIDGGRTWTFKSGLIQRRQNPHTVQLQAVQFLDERRGFIASGDGRILRTLDGGENWHSVGGGGRQLSDLQFVDDRYGWAVGGPTLVRSTDGGESWERPIPYESEQSFTGHALRFLDRELGWAVGTAGAIYRTTDGGMNWEESVRPKSGKPDLRALSFVDADRGWAVGERGTVLHTVDGGRTWSQQRTHTRSFLTGVHFTDPGTGWAVGFERRDSSSVVLHTTDGGQSWTQQLRVEGQALFALTFIETGHGWAIGERVRPHEQRLLHYEPRGKNR